MKLKRNNSHVDNTEKTDIIKKIEENDLRISKLQEENVVLKNNLLELSISPFKLGSYALVEVNKGKSVQKCKCLLESEDDVLYARPLKNDGELSGRHFIVGNYNNDLKSLLRPVEE